MPILPVSREALLIAVNLVSAVILLPEAMRPGLRGWWQVGTVTMLCANLVLAAVNLTAWLGLMPIP